MYYPEKTIIMQGDRVSQGKEDFLYFICRGEWEVFVYDQNKEEQLVKELNTGKYFGEVALLREWARTSTVRSKNYSTLTQMPTKEFNGFKAQFPEIIEKMSKKIYNYKDVWK